MLPNISFIHIVMILWWQKAEEVHVLYSANTWPTTPSSEQKREKPQRKNPEPLQNPEIIFLCICKKPEYSHDRCIISMQITWKD